MGLIHHDGGQAGEHLRRIGQGEQQGQALGGGQQQVRRAFALALAAIDGGVAGAGLDGDGQAHLGHWRGQVARDVHSQGLERGNIERVQPLARVAREIHQRGQEPRQRLAPAGRRQQQDVFAPPGRAQERHLVRPRRPATRGEPAGERFWQCSHSPGNMATVQRAGKPPMRASGASMTRWQGERQCRIASMLCRVSAAQVAGEPRRHAVPPAPPQGGKA